MVFHSTVRHCAFAARERREGMLTPWESREQQKQKQKQKKRSGCLRGGPSFGFSGPDVRPGDWYCSCAAHNFASRSSCFECGALKEDSAAAVGFDGEVPATPRGYGLGAGGGDAR
ncbi:RNA-binding protein C17H9.04c [Musa troglodytarum]|uniref:RNA-binding protein C17H9.04c n=1 Tax=Musa troglodytarum TaxID=320322 RepID=A0A9E7I7V3_9LILI|nr:RNA-binding protein C17H9.04c [Musa troglodytarum]